MEFIKPDINVDFVGRRKTAYLLSAALIALSIVSLIAHGGPRYGIDFAGGIVIQIKFPEATTAGAIKTALSPVGLASVMVQRFGEAEDNEYLLRADIGGTPTEGIAQEVEAALRGATGKEVEVRRVEVVGPQVGKDLRAKALFAMFFALLFINIYISGRFEFKWTLSALVAGALIGAVLLASRFQVSIPVLIAVALMASIACFWFLRLKYAMGAIVALIHDVMITVGIFSIFGKEFTLPIIAALLTVIGYSLNDTIIVFDRIRENTRKYNRQAMETIVNRSINETLSRTILTSGTTLIVVLALFIFGGGIIHDFAFALLVGIAVGTYSSIYVASPILLAWHEESPGKNRRKKKRS